MDRKTKELTPDEISNVVGGGPGAEYITREDAEICYGDPEMGPVLSFPFGHFTGIRNSRWTVDLSPWYNKTVITMNTGNEMVS